MNAINALSTIASTVLAFLTFYLARHRNVHVFIVVGQEVFKWITATLVCITITRIFVYTNLVGTNISREINGAVYILSVLGIILSVGRHARNQ